jgi:hypothetical protein
MTSYSIGASPAVPGLPAETASITVPADTTPDAITYTFTVTARDSSGSATATASVTIEPSSQAWVPVGNGLIDYCRKVGAGPDNVSSYIACTPFNGTSFGATVSSGLVDWGYPTGASWVPVGGGVVDYCRRDGAGPDNVSSYIACTPFNGTSFGATVTSGVVDWGYPTGVSWVPVGSGVVDYCRQVGAGPDHVNSYLACTKFNGTSFGATVTSGLVDWGYSTGASWVSPSSGTADYCRRVGAGPDNVNSYVACTPFNGTSFGDTVTSGLLDWGYSTGLSWVPAGSGVVDYCRQDGAGPDNVNSYIACTPFTGTSFGATVTSKLLDWGYATGVSWVPVGKGVVDYCRRVGAGPDHVNSYIACNKFTGTSFGTTVTSKLLDWGYSTGVSWASISSGKADYCRQVGAGPDNVNSYIACTPFTGTTFGATVTSGLVDWGYPT